MTYEEMEQLLAPVGIPFALHHWERPPAMPFGVYFDGSTDNFEADDRAYAVITSFSIELYTRQRTPALEAKIEAVLDGAGLYWDRDATYVDALRAYMTTYEIEV